MLEILFLSIKLVSSTIYQILIFFSKWFIIIYYYLFLLLFFIFYYYFYIVFIFYYYYFFFSKKLWKMFFISCEKLFYSWNIQIFLFLSSLLFLSVSHCFKGWSNINLKVYDVINCLNKNSITHFVWYLGKKKRYDIETLFIDRLLNKERFHEKIIQKKWTKI